MMLSGPDSHSRASFHMDIPAATRVSQMKPPGAIFQGSRHPSAAPIIQDAGG